MKNVLLVLLVLLSSLHGISQTGKERNGPLTSGTAPSFKAISTMGEINFPDDYFGKWKILFSHPADFTPVCTSEILALAASHEEFEKLKTQLIVISTDGLNSHIEWIKSMESISNEGFSPVKIDFPLIADSDLEVSKLYGLLQANSGERKDIRGVVFIDTENKIRAFFHYPNTVGRNIEEVKRTLIALQTQDKHNVQTPANWKPGDEVLIKSPSSIQESEKLERKQDASLRKVTWYMWFKKL
ncbi:MAG: peroxiredoxin (alkyl hydroperoxide reductase subunit C) [Bacteroidetes bacterium]|nr:MAG: peroxiredoxin (alkyl hydroperoxide reductase subunit C) [Bacteroidota bacterium]